MDSPDKSEGDPVDFFKLMEKVAPFEPIPRRINSLKVAFNAAPIVRKASALEAVWLLENNPNRLEQIIGSFSPPAWGWSGEKTSRAVWLR